MAIHIGRVTVDVAKIEPVTQLLDAAIEFVDAVEEVALSLEAGDHLDNGRLRAEELRDEISEFRAKVDALVSSRGSA